MIETVEHNSKIMAIIIRSSYTSQGIEFFTPDDFSQQLAYMRREKGYLIEPHIHNSIPRTVNYTNEVLYIKSGKLRADFYNDNKDYLKSMILSKGDVILLASGGHGFKIIEEAEIIEIKQGPYAGELDKERFKSISPKKIQLTGDKD